MLILQWQNPLDIDIKITARGGKFKAGTKEFESNFINIGVTVFSA